MWSWTRSESLCANPNRTNTRFGSAQCSRTNFVYELIASSPTFNPLNTALKSTFSHWRSRSLWVSSSEYVITNFVVFRNCELFSRLYNMPYPVTWWSSRSIRLLLIGNASVFSQALYGFGNNDQEQCELLSESTPYISAQDGIRNVLLGCTFVYS